MAWGTPASLGGGVADSGSSSSATSGTITAPTSGDFLFQALAVNAASVTSLTAPTGWTKLRESQDASGCYSALFARVADGTSADTQGGAVTSYSWTGSGRWRLTNVYHA